MKNIHKTDQAIFHSGKEMVLEEIGLDSQGHPALYLTKKAPLKDKNNQIIGIIGTSINITGHFQIKDYIIRHTTGNVYWKDLSGSYLGCNDSYAEMIGLSFPSDIVGRNDRDLFYSTLGKERVALIEEIDQSVMQQGEERTLEEIGVDSKGRLAIYMTKKVPMRNNDNKIIGLVGASLDITQQRKAESAKLEFLRNMSHDIMTPFTGILGISSVLYEEETDPNKKLHLECLMQSSERLLQLFRQILEIAEHGGRQLKLEQFDIKELVSETLEAVSVSARYKNLELRLSCPNKIINSDKLRVARILLNLLGNAIKFTDSGFIQVDVNCESGLEISVQDTGPGIPSDKLEVIFEKFYKLSESGKHNNFAGSGIGLYIAKQFANDLGGNIFAESKIGQGSTFIFKANVNQT